MKNRGYVLFFYIFVLLFNVSFAMDRLDKSTSFLNNSAGAPPRSPRVPGNSGSHIGAPNLSLSPSFMGLQETTALGLSPSIERFTACHRQGTETFMQAFEEYVKNLHQKNEDTFRALLPQFYTACTHYLDAWEHGDPTAEDGYIRSFKYAEIILKELLEKNRHAGATVYPEQHHVVFQRAQQLRDRDNQPYSATNEPSSEKDPRQLYSKGFRWFLLAKADKSQFEMQRDATYAQCAIKARWAAEFLISSFEKKQQGKNTRVNFDSLKCLLYTLQDIRPKSWGYATWPDMVATAELKKTVAKLNHLLAIDGTTVQMAAYWQALERLRSLSQAPSSPSLQESFSHDSVAESVATAARAAALGKSDDSSSSDESQEQLAGSPAAAAADFSTIPPLTFHPADSGGDNVPPDKPTGSRQSRKLTPRFLNAILHPKGNGKKDEQK